MRLTRWARAWLALLGLGLLSAGGIGAAQKWSDVALAAFIALGGLVLLGAVVGAMPKGSIKDGFEWPDVDKHPRIEKIEADIAALREKIEAEIAALQAEVATVRKEAKDVKDLLIDYVLAHEPEPEDGMTDKDRRRELQERVIELEAEIDARYSSGETYDDGIDVKQLETNRGRVWKDLDREERRQAARVRFGLPLNNEQRPAKRN